MKKVICSLVALLVVTFSVTTAFAAGINSYEQSVLSQMNTPANMNGNSVYVPSSYVNQAETYFNTIDMTASQASQINSIISECRSFLEGTGKSGVGELSGSEKSTLMSYASSAAAVLNLTAAAGSDTTQVKVLDEDGNVIVDESGDVIKTTGGTYVAPSFVLPAFLTVLALTGSYLLITSYRKKEG